LDSVVVAFYCYLQCYRFRFIEFGSGARISNGKIYQEVITIEREEIFFKGTGTVQMDSAEIKLIQKAFIKERGAEIFVKKSDHLPHLVRAL
jgi:hypothetical protein